MYCFVRWRETLNNADADADACAFLVRGVYNKQSSQC